jgi:arginyl-tRNA synthetase
MIAQTIRVAIEELIRMGQLPPFDVPCIQVERPKDERFGEYTSNIALIAAKIVGKNPRALAELIRKQLTNNSKQETFFEKIEVAGPGHLNLYLTQSVLGGVVEEIAVQKDQYGTSDQGAGQSVNNEFVSANPTGPLHLGNGRGGFFGDTLSRVLRKAGYAVTNEYYVNDAGEQILKLGHSVLKNEEAVYGGEYIETLMERFEKQITDNRQQDGEGVVKEAGEWAARIILEEMIKKTLSDQMQIAFDVFTSEKREVIEQGYVEKAFGILKEKGLTFEEEGALWLRTSAFGDDKDRVLVKSDGTRTYFASDCGYILSKMDRGFTRLILTLGADHHGYRARLEAAAQALGFVGRFDFIFVQLVRLMKDGQEVRMSKRAGNVVSIDELIERVGPDVARFFFLMYSPDTHMNFDLGLAEERSQKNPVYYVQYAHARLASILRKAEESRLNPDQGNALLLVDPKERLLLAELISFPDLILDTAEDYAVHRLPQYAIRLADRLHSFYDACRVIDAEQPEISEARLRLVKSAKIVLSETLRLIGVSAPEKM